RRCFARIAGVLDAEAHRSAYRNRRTRLQRHRADARKSSRHYASVHDRPRLEATGCGAPLRERVDAVARASRASLRPLRPSDRAPARPHLRTTVATALRRDARAERRRPALAAALHAFLQDTGEDAAPLDQIVADGLRVALTGASDVREQAIIAQITAACAPSTRNDLIDFAGALTLQELAALTARARAFIGVDSAPMHIAAAVQTPTLAFFGPSDEATWGPWLVPHRIVASTVHPCRPCNLDGCGGGKVSECLTTLAADGVHAKFLSLLRDAAGDST